MPKTMLTGSLDEQCEVLYQLAQEKMRQGNFTGAVHALAEVVKHQPDYKDAARVLEMARAHKRTQRRTLLLSLLGAILFIGIGSVSGLAGDIWLLALGIVGLFIGYGAANFIGSMGANTSAQ